MDRYRRLVLATGIPSAVLEALELDPSALPSSVVAIVHAHVGAAAWLEALAAETLPARARVLLEAIARRRDEDEAAA